MRGVYDVLKKKSQIIENNSKIIDINSGFLFIYRIFDAKEQLRSFIY